MKIQLLTSEEKTFAEKHHDLVERFLSRNQLDEADFYDVVIFGYLHAVQDYLAKPELSKYHFSTIAWRQMKHSIVEELIYQNRPKRNVLMGTYHENYASASLDEFLPNRINCLAETLDNQKQLGKLLSYLTPKEKEVVYMRADGYTYQEIAETCNLTIKGVSSRVTRMRRRLRHMTLAETR